MQVKIQLCVSCVCVLIFGKLYEDVLNQSGVGAGADPSSPGQLGAHDETRLAKTSGQNNTDLGN